MSKLAILNDRTPFWGTKLTTELKFLQQILNQKNNQIRLNNASLQDLFESSS